MGRKGSLSLWVLLSRNENKSEIHQEQLSPQLLRVVHHRPTRGANPLTHGRAHYGATPSAPDHEPKNMNAVQRPGATRPARIRTHQWNDYETASFKNSGYG